MTKLVVRNEITVVKTFSNTATVEIITHCNGFHADEVAACAAIAVANKMGSVEIIRTRDSAIIEDAKASDRYLVDLGGEYNPDDRNFDHHQTKGGIEGMASFGMVAKYLKLNLTGKFVKDIDDHDNGLTKNELSQFVTKFNPPFGASEERSDEAFCFAVEMMARYICSDIDFNNGLDKAKKLIKEAKRLDNVLVLTEGCGWKEIIHGDLDEYSDLDTVICPTKGRGGIQWNILKVPSTKGSFQFVGAPLHVVEGQEGFVFCHAAGFMAACKTMENAIEFAKAQ